MRAETQFKIKPSQDWWIETTFCTCYKDIITIYNSSWHHAINWSIISFPQNFLFIQVAQRTRRLSVYWYPLSLTDRRGKLQLAVHLSLWLPGSWRENCDLKKRVSLLLGWDRVQDSCPSGAAGMGCRPLLSWWLLRYVLHFWTLSFVWLHLNLIYLFCLFCKRQSIRICHYKNLKEAGY